MEGKPTPPTIHLHIPIYIHLPTSTSTHPSIHIYIHNITQLKHGSNRPYFEAEIQQKQSSETVFKPVLHAQFEAVNNDSKTFYSSQYLSHFIHPEINHVLFTCSQLDYTYNPNISSKEKDLPISEILKSNTSYHKVQKLLK